MRLIPDADVGRELSDIPVWSTAIAFFGFDREDVEHALDATGFIVPRGEADVLASTWVSSKWAGRAPEGSVLLRAFVGGPLRQDAARHASDDVIADIAIRELRRLMGRLGEPRLTRVHRYRAASPQPVVGHAKRMRRVFERLERLPGLFLAGGGYDGIGVPDCVRQGRDAAKRINKYLDETGSD